MSQTWAIGMQLQNITIPACDAGTKPTPIDSLDSRYRVNTRTIFAHFVTDPNVNVE